MANGFKCRVRCTSKSVFHDSRFFFSFSACPKAGGRCRATCCRTGVSAYQRLHVPLNLAFESTIDICDSDLEIWKRLLTLFFFFEIWLCKHRGANAYFLFFFFAVDRTTNRVQTPSPPYESSFVCPRRVKFWDDPWLGNAGPRSTEPRRQMLLNTSWSHTSQDGLFWDIRVSN